MLEPVNQPAIQAPYRLEKMSAYPGVMSYRAHGQGPDLVLLHGIGSGSGSWRHQFDQLGQSFRLTAWDAPGYGQSDIDTGAMAGVDAYVASLRALLDGLKINSMILVGHSLGALIAARFVRSLPDRVKGLVLADPAQGHKHLPQDVRQQRMAERLDRLQKLGAKVHARQRAPLLLSARAQADDIELVRENMASVTLDGYKAAAKLLRDGDLLSDVAELDVAALVLCGSEDEITPSATCREVAAGFRGGRPFYEIEHAGHASYIEQAHAFNAHVAAFARTCP